MATNLNVEDLQLDADARRIWSFAHDDLGFADDQIVLFGKSLGGAVALSSTESHEWIFP